MVWKARIVNLYRPREVKDFISDPDVHIKNVQIITSEMIHAQCCGQPRTHSDKSFETLTQRDVRKMQDKDKKK